MQGLFFTLPQLNFLLKINYAAENMKNLHVFILKDWQMVENLVFGDWAWVSVKVELFRENLNAACRFLSLFYFLIFSYETGKPRFRTRATIRGDREQTPHQQPTKQPKRSQVRQNMPPVFEKKKEWNFCFEQWWKVTKLRKCCQSKDSHAHKHTGQRGQLICAAQFKQNLLFLQWKKRKYLHGLCL